jgi:hypothetical protein
MFGLEQAKDKGKNFTGGLVGQVGVQRKIEIKLEMSYEQWTSA